MLHVVYPPTMQIVRSEVLKAGGYISEDGASFAVGGLVSHAATATEKLAGVGMTKDTEHGVVGGRITLAFHQPADALHCVTNIRERMLNNTWSDALLAHPLCEPVSRHRHGLHMLCITLSLPCMP